MHRAEDYRRRAEEAEEKVEQADDPEELDALSRVAAAWRQLAEDVARQSDGQF